MNRGPAQASKLDEALERVRVRWDEARTQRTVGELATRRALRRRRRSLTFGVGAGGLVAGTVGLLMVLQTPGEQRARDSGPLAGGSEQPSVVTGARPLVRDLELEDGSRVVLLDRGARVALATSSPSRVELRLSAGRARFEVTKNPQRAFRVRAGKVTVEVLGTTFELERREEQTHVEVAEGKVAVSWAGQRVELEAGAAGWFPPSAREPERRAAVSERLTPAAGPAAAANQRPRARKASWREHAERGEFKDAFALLERGDAPVAPRVAELLLAADAARLSGHPGAAVPYLRRVIDSHPSDARAPLAAFTLGGVLMNQLGLPREAADAYGWARKGTRSAALAQDALARQVEAANRAGDAALARRLADQYLQEYPRGRRLGAVRRFGGLK